MNLRLQEQHEAIEVVAGDLLRDLELLPADSQAIRSELEPPSAGLLAYMWSRRSELTQYTIEHVALSAVALTLGILLAVPLALALDRFRTGTSETLIRIIGMSQTLPSLALFGFLIPLLGAGGLGQPIIAGVQLVNIHQILSGAIPAALLALVADAALGGLGRLLRPRGVGP